MKRLIFGAAILAITLVMNSCSDDDDTSVIPDVEEGDDVGGEDGGDDGDDGLVDLGQVVINEFSPSGNWVEFHNQSDVAVDASGYWLCLAPGTYRNINDSTILSGTTEIPANGFLVVEYDFASFSAVASGGLGLYLNNDGFGNSVNILDFVQYGDAGSARENVAVEAGIWELDDFVPNVGVDTSSFAFDGEGNSSSDWSEALAPTVGLDNDTVIVVDPIVGDLTEVVINEFSPSGNWVELHNPSNGVVDVAGTVLCLGSGTYVDVIQDIVLDGEIIIPANGFLVVSYSFASVAGGASGGLGLYVDRSGFTNPDNILDFVQYGAAGSQREVVAVAAGIWELNDFIPSLVEDSSSFAYDGEGDSSGDWSEASLPTVGAVN